MAHYREDIGVQRLLRFRRRADWLLLLVDIGSAILVCWLAFLLRFEGDPVPTQYVQRYRIATGFIAVTVVITGRAAGFYRRSALRQGESLLSAAFEAATATGFALLVFNYIALDGKISRAWIGLVTLGLLLAGLG